MEKYMSPLVWLLETHFLPQTEGYLIPSLPQVKHLYPLWLPHFSIPHLSEDSETVAKEHGEVQVNYLLLSLSCHDKNMLSLWEETKEEHV